MRAVLIFMLCDSTFLLCQTIENDKKIEEPIVKYKI